MIRKTDKSVGLSPQLAAITVGGIVVILAMVGFALWLLLRSRSEKGR